MKALQRYLGTINFLAKFVYGMQPLLQTLYNLLHKETELNWTSALNTGIGAALLQQHPTEKKMKLISANSRLFTPIEMRFLTLIRECSSRIFALTEYEFLTGSSHLIVLFTNHKPIIYLFTHLL